MLPEFRRLFWTLLILPALGACSTTPSPTTDPEPGSPYIGSAAGTGERALHLAGELKGPGFGLGPQLSFEAWIRSDRWVRADLHFEDEDGNAAHEVLVWGPDTCMLFDRRKGRYTELGALPGDLDLEEGSFRVQHALWLVLGRWVGKEALPGRWEGREWRARDRELGLRAAFEKGNLEWTELVWRGEQLQGSVQELQESPWGAIPRRMELSGSILESVAKAEWRAKSIPVFGDEILDPLMDP